MKKDQNVNQIKYKLNYYYKSGSPYDLDRSLLFLFISLFPLAIILNKLFFENDIFQIPVTSLLLFWITLLFLSSFFFPYGRTSITIYEDSLSVNPKKPIFKILFITSKRFVFDKDLTIIYDKRYEELRFEQESKAAIISINP